MLKLKPFIYSPSVRLHRRLAGSPIADSSSDSFPVKSLTESTHQSIHYFSLPILPTRRRSFSVSMESSGVSTTSPSVVKLKPIEATAETFKEFGQVIAFDFYYHILFMVFRLLHYFVVTDSLLLAMFFFSVILCFS